MTYTISLAAKLLRVSPQSLSSQEKQELIPRPNRHPANIREYTEADLEAIRAFLGQKNLKR